MFWKKKQKFTDRAVAYLVSTAPDVSALDAELPSEATPIVAIYSDDLRDGQFRKFVMGEYAAAIPPATQLAFCDSQI